jgi:hypothetical protein
MSGNSDAEEERVTPQGRVLPIRGEKSKNTEHVAEDVV